MTDALFDLAKRHGYAQNASEAPVAYLERVIAGRAAEPWAMLAKRDRQMRMAVAELSDLKPHISQLPEPFAVIMALHVDMALEHLK